MFPTDSIQTTMASAVAAAWMTPASKGSFRPPQWANNDVPPLLLVALDPQTNQNTAYVFDGVIRAEHTQKLEYTRNPVQTGAPIADHAYVTPPTVTAEIHMSDAMQSYVIDQWADADSRSVSAYRTLLRLQASRQPIAIFTRLNQYENMLIADVYAVEEQDTRYGLRAMVTFVQILTAYLSTSVVAAQVQNPISARPQTTASTSIGTIPPSTVGDAVERMNRVSKSDIGTADAGATQVTLRSGDKVSIGQKVLGKGIAPATTVSKIAGTSLILNQATTAALTQTPMRFITPSSLAPTLSTMMVALPRVANSGDWSSYPITSISTSLKGALPPALAGMF